MVWNDTNWKKGIEEENCNDQKAWNREILMVLIYYSHLSLTAGFLVSCDKNESLSLINLTPELDMSK